jgi:hypothetical protein
MSISIKGGTRDRCQGIFGGNSGFVLGRHRPPREACDNFWDAGSRTLSAHSRNRGPLVCGLSGIETGGWRDPRSARAHQNDRLAVSGMRSGMQTVRPSARTAMATPGYLPSCSRDSVVTVPGNFGRIWLSTLPRMARARACLSSGTVRVLPRAALPPVTL